MGPSAVKADLRLKVSTQQKTEGWMQSGASRQQKADKSHRTLIKRGCRVTLPDSVSPFRLGQRVYFSAKAGQICISPHPVRARDGRLPSTRIRRNTDSWFRYLTGSRKKLAGN